MGDVVNEEWVEKVRGGGPICVVKEVPALCDSWLALRKDVARLRVWLCRIEVLATMDPEAARRSASEALAGTSYETSRVRMIDDAAADFRSVLRTWGRPSGLGIEAVRYQGQAERRRVVVRWPPDGVRWSEFPMEAHRANPSEDDLAAIIAVLRAEAAKEDDHV